MKTTSLYGMQVALGAVALAAGAATLAGTDIMVRQFDLIGLGQSFRLVVGAIELIAGLSLFVPRAGTVGALLLACLMVGTIGATIGHMATMRTSPLPADRLSVSQAYEASLRAGDAFVRPIAIPARSQGWDI